MSMKLYVGNLSFETTEEQLNTLFSEAGPVTSAKIITDRQTGQPRGFGFVEMETKAAGQKAISMFNGKNVEGRPLSVNEAKPQQKSGGFGGGGGGGRRGGWLPVKPECRWPWSGPSIFRLSKLRVLKGGLWSPFC